MRPFIGRRLWSRPFFTSHLWDVPRWRDVSHHLQACGLSHQLHLRITPRRDIANFMAGDAVRIVNFHRTGFWGFWCLKIASSWVNALPVLRWRSSLPRLVTTIQAKVILASFWLSGCTYGFSTQRHLGSVVDTGDRLPDRKLRLYFSCKDRNRQSWNVLSWVVQLCPAGDAKLKTHRIVTFRVRNLFVTSANVWESGELRICNIWERIVIRSDNCARWAGSTFTSQSKRESGWDEIRPLGTFLETCIATFCKHGQTLSQGPFMETPWKHGQRLSLGPLRGIFWEHVPHRPPPAPHPDDIHYRFQALLSRPLHQKKEPRNSYKRIEMEYNFILIYSRRCIFSGINKWR